MVEPIVGGVPADWESLTLAELCERGRGDIQTGPFGSQLHASDYVPVGVPSVMPQDIGDNVIHEESIARVTQDDADRLSKYQLRPGDIVYSRRGDVERRALVLLRHTGWLCGTGCLRVRPGIAADSRFLYYYLGHTEVRAWIVRHAVGATMANLNTKILGAVPVALPPVSIQSAIAATLGALDHKIAVNVRIATTALSLAQSTFLDLPNESNRGVLVGDVLKFRYGKSLPARERLEGPVPVYGSGGIGGSHNEALVKGPGIIVGRKGTVGSVHWEHRDFFPIDTTFFIALKDPSFSMEYAYFALKSLDLGNMNSDSVVPGLNRSDALALKLRAAAPEHIQQFTRRIQPLFELKAHVTTENVTLAALRDTLLAQLMSGKLRVRDDE